MDLRPATIFVAARWTRSMRITSFLQLPTTGCTEKLLNEYLAEKENLEQLLSKIGEEKHKALQRIEAVQDEFCGVTQEMKQLQAQRKLWLHKLELQRRNYERSLEEVTSIKKLIEDLTSQIESEQRASKDEREKIQMFDLSTVPLERSLGIPGTRVQAHHDEVAQWLECEFTDRNVRGSKPTYASRLALSRLGQPDSIPALVLPSAGMAVDADNSNLCMAELEVLR
ncbi:hypothetical protein CSKR_102254, partial [Clonorchis sinensis]